jgi:hypothetical protein
MRSNFGGLNLVLLLVAALLGAALFMQVGMGADASGADGGAVAPERAPLATGEGVPFAPPPIQSVAAILERPLFVEGRVSAARPDAVSGGNDAGPPPTLKLEGVAISPDNKVALLRDLRTNELIRLASGASRDGWKVLEVAADAVRIEHRGRELVLKLEIREGGTPTAAPGVPFKPPVIRPPARR